jgi:hypothetical protein
MKKLIRVLYEELNMRRIPTVMNLQCKGILQMNVLKSRYQKADGQSQALIGITLIAI